MPKPDRPRISILTDEGTPRQRARRVVFADDGGEQLLRGLRIVRAEEPDATITLLPHADPAARAHVVFGDDGEPVIPEGILS